MKIKEIVKLLNCEVIVNNELSMDQEINQVGAGDMMSDILAFAKPGTLILSSHVSPQIIRTAVVTDLIGVIIVMNKDIPDTTVQLAKQNNFLLLKTKYYMFEACGIIYSAIKNK